MRHFVHYIIAVLLLLPWGARAQYEEDTENGVVSLAGKEGFSIATKKGDFVFKPYMLVQTSASVNYYDDEGLDPAYNQDNVHNSGFAIPYAILGFTGKAFDRLTFNLSINAAGSGGNILQQAWFDYEVKESFAIRVGKFKTPFTHAYLTTLGETLMPTLPVSLTSAVILPYSLNAVTPNIGTGFDLGVEIRGLVKKKFGYEVGIFYGTGSSVNVANKTFSEIQKGKDIIVIQDDSIAGWHKGFFGKDVQNSCLGTLKAKFKADSRTMVIGQFFPSTAVCPICGHKHDGMKLGVERFACPHCGYCEERDTKAAITTLLAGEIEHSSTHAGHMRTPVELTSDFRSFYEGWKQSAGKPEAITL